MRRLVDLIDIEIRNDYGAKFRAIGELKTARNL